MNPKLTDSLAPLRSEQIVDHDRNGVKVWESGSIFLYLAKHYDTEYKLHFENDQEEAEMVRLQVRRCLFSLSLSSLCGLDRSRGSSSVIRPSVLKPERSGSSLTTPRSSVPLSRIDLTR